jgi:hypothetical protein
VVAVLARQDLGALRLLLGASEKPEHLDERVVRLGPGVRVEDPAALEGRDLDQLLRQHHRLVGHAPEEGVVAREAVVLRLGGGGEAGMVEARDHVPEARVRVEVALAVDVDDIGPFAVGQDDGAAVADRGQVGEAVERELLGPGLPAVLGVVRHDALRRWGSAGRYRSRGAASIGLVANAGRVPRQFVG